TKMASERQITHPGSATQPQCEEQVSLCLHATMRQCVAGSFLTNQFRACGSAPFPVSFGSGVRYKGQRRRGVRVNAGELPAKTFCREADGQSQRNSETLTQAYEGKPRRDSGLSSPWPCRRGVAPADRSSRGDLHHVVEPEPSRAAPGQRRRLAGRRGVRTRPGRIPEEYQEGPVLHQELWLSPFGRDPQRRPACARRADPDRSRQGTRLRGRRL